MNKTNIIHIIVIVSLLETKSDSIFIFQSVFYVILTFFERFQGK